MSLLNPSDPLASVIDSLSRDSGYSTYPGIDGIPHRSRGVRNYRHSDPPSMQPRQGGKVHTEIFTLDTVENQKKYENHVSLVYSMAQAGKAKISFVDRRYDEKTGVWRVFVEWIELFTYDPQPATLGVTGSEVRRG